MGRNMGYINDPKLLLNFLLLGSKRGDFKIGRFLTTMGMYLDLVVKLSPMHVSLFSLTMGVL